MGDNDHIPRISPLMKQIWTVAGVMLSILAQGMAQGFISVLLTALKKPDTPIKVDVHLASWLVSGMAMSVIVGICISTTLMEVFGRKTTFILGIVPGVTAILLMYSASNFTTILVARLLDGVTAGGIVTLGAVIIGEYVNPAYRGMFLNLKTACICLGSTIVHGLGHCFYWRTVALIALVPYGTALLIIFTWPESPAWLASKNRLEESEKAFLWLRGDTVKSRAELKDLFRAQEDNAALKFKTSFLVKVKTFFKKWKRKDFIQPVLIMVSCTALLEMCGRHIIPAYTNDIVGSIVGNHNQSFYYTLTIDLIVTVSAMCSSVLIKFMKTRTLLFSSGILSLLILFLACLYLFLATHDIITKDRPWIPLGLFIVYFVLVNLGCTPISLALVGEVIPLEHKPYVIFAYSLIGCIFIVVTLKVFPYLMLYVDIYGTFLVFGTIMSVMLTILYFTLPETKNKTLQEIEDFIKFGKAQNRGRCDEETNKFLE